MANLDSTMSFQRTSDPLGRALRRTIPERPFNVCFWDGTVVEATNHVTRAPGSIGVGMERPAPTTSTAPTFEVKRPAALAHVLRAPSALGLGRAYVEGSLDVDDLDAATSLVGEWRPPPLSLADRARLLAGIALAALPGGLARRPRLELILRGKRHSPARDAAAVRYHYDAGNDFFRLFLDESMTYSCAIYSRGAKTLEQAQRTKLDLVATKLGLEPGMSVLDVGCGWGAFAIHAAVEHGVTVTGLTLSPAQAELARARVAAAGLSDRVQILVSDYRELGSGRFDAISSIGMSEHVGTAQIDNYAASLHRLLRPGGALLNHAIAAIDDDERAHGSEFTMRYVFPDGELLPLSRVQLAFERAGFETDHVEGFREDYSRTLTEWARRLEERLEEAERLVGAERLRVWRLYLRGARHGFDAGLTAVYQVRAHRPA
jgi:cyclopropane-fatty-acyl-phospholipid synthase